MHRRPRGLNAGLILLLTQIFQVGVNNIPPVTLATLAVNIWFFLSPLKPLLSSCLSVETCYQEKDWQRLLLSPLHHADDWHLYFNMVSMLWKGIQLERRLGSRWFAYVITTFSLLTGVVYLSLEFALAEFLDEPGFKRNCAIGFSGVLFALKVLSNHYYPGGFVNVLNIPVPIRFACWAELVAIHLISPGTSFAGHLAGILVGLMYIHGPLKKIMEMCTGIFSFNTGYRRQQHYFNSSGHSGFGDYYPYSRPGYQEAGPRSYDTYTAGLSEEEQLERALRASLQDQESAKVECGTRMTKGNEEKPLLPGPCRRLVEPRPSLRNNLLAVLRVGKPLPDFPDIFSFAPGAAWRPGCPTWTTESGVRRLNEGGRLVWDRRSAWTRRRRQSPARGRRACA